MEKRYENAQIDHFNQQTACEATVCWLKYTTVAKNLQKIVAILISGSISAFHPNV